MSSHSIVLEGDNFHVLVAVQKERVVVTPQKAAADDED
jgi:hypothetical protein